MLCGFSAYQLQVCNTLTNSTIIPSEDEFKCIPANFSRGHVCRTLFPNLTRVMTPNFFQINEERKGFFSSHTPGQHFEASMVEFGKLVGLLTEKDQCFGKICFFYFPSCNDVQISNGCGPYLQGYNCMYGEDKNRHTRQSKVSRLTIYKTNC